MYALGESPTMTETLFFNNFKSMELKCHACFLLFAIIFQHMVHIFILCHAFHACIYIYIQFEEVVANRTSKCDQFQLQSKISILHIKSNMC